MLVALVLALLTAASYAELVTKYPQAGGSAVFAARAYRRPVISFLVGFCMLSAGVVSAAGLALAFAGDYLGTFIDVDPVLGAVVFLDTAGATRGGRVERCTRASTILTQGGTPGLSTGGNDSFNRAYLTKPHCRPLRTSDYQRELLVDAD